MTTQEIIWDGMVCASGQAQMALSVLHDRLKWHGLCFRTGSNGMVCASGQAQMTGCFEHCNETSGYIKFGEILG
jgi:hypothetical protein